MKATAIRIAGFLAPLSWSATAHAAVRRDDFSGVFVWVFLGFCAIIVVAQLIPAILMVLGLAKGVKSVVNETATEKADKHGAA